MSTIFWWSPQCPLYKNDSLTTLYRPSLYAVSLSLSLYAVSLCCTTVTTLCWSLRCFTTVCFTMLYRSSLCKFEFFVCLVGCPEVPPSSSPHFVYYNFSRTLLQGGGCSILFLWISHCFYWVFWWEAVPNRVDCVTC